MTICAISECHRRNLMDFQMVESSKPDILYRHGQAYLEGFHTYCHRSLPRSGRSLHSHHLAVLCSSNLGRSSQGRHRLHRDSTTYMLNSTTCPTDWNRDCTVPRRTRDMGCTIQRQVRCSGPGVRSKARNRTRTNRSGWGSRHTQSAQA